LKIFISWSGPLSGQVAEALRDWLPSVLQTVVPYVSSEDIHKGARWSVDVSRELETSTYGILCVTASNVDAPWLNFEAGALSKSFDKGRVSPFLFGVDRSDVTGPLVQFQSTIYDRDDVLKLVKSINMACEVPLESARLDEIFDVWWPRLRRRLDALSVSLDATSAETPSRSVDDMVSEILDIVRAQQLTLSSSIRQATGDINNSVRTVNGVDLTEVAYLLARLTAIAEQKITPGGPETSRLVQISALVLLLGNVLRPLLDLNTFNSILRQTKEGLRDAGIENSGSLDQVGE
jgi:hypothetical protein